MHKPVRCIDYSSVSTIVSNGFWNCDVCVVVVFVCYNFTCYCCLIDNLHTSCSGLHNKYICIQVDRAKEFFFSSLNFSIRTKCGTIYVIKKEHYNKFCHPPHPMLFLNPHPWTVIFHAIYIELSVSLQEEALMQTTFLFYSCTWANVILPRKKELLFWIYRDKYSIL